MTSNNSQAFSNAKSTKQFKIIVGGVYLASYTDTLQVTDNLSLACTFYDESLCELVAAAIARGTNKQVKIQINR